ncbi:Uncharacterized protein FKW44_004989 [Caligus rogercresseyi]|uniref:Uncharacterized protein n=1 Tax=Caligus rogercresseyi TaxID=217165 RepID=A0A7T8KAV3_CALRO|nr:Uncharacterized protein FKW44_004989 [Caligus rogercresseyi]
MGKSSLPLCRLCEEEDETPIHLIYACPRTKMEMDELAEDVGRRKKSLEKFLWEAFLRLWIYIYFGIKISFLTVLLRLIQD